MENLRRYFELFKRVQPDTTTQYQQELEQLYEALWVIRANNPYTQSIDEIGHYKGLPFFIPSGNETSTFYNSLIVCRGIDDRTQCTDLTQKIGTLIRTTCWGLIELTLVYKQLPERFTPNGNIFHLRHQLVGIDTNRWLNDEDNTLFELEPPSKDQLNLQSIAGIKTAINRVKSWETIDCRNQLN